MSADDAWSGLARQRFRLQVGLHFEPHQYRGERWVVAHDRTSNRAVRLSPAAYDVLLALDGATLEQAAERLDVKGETDRADLLTAVRSLLGSELLIQDVAQGTSQLIQRRRLLQAARSAGRWRSPLSVRIPLLDPDAFLDRTVHLVQPFFGVWGALAWLAVVSAALVVAGLHWEPLTENVTDRVLATSNVFLLGLVFPLIKMVHEFGHAYATKVWGGEVHEMGIMLIVFFPIPYVDASSASAFPEKSRRTFVGAAGMGIELVIASLALFAWVSIEPGLLRSCMYNAILIASVSTVVFNANPLLRFDGYYIFSDLIEIPNLASRATRCTGDWIHHVFFRIERPAYDATPPRERALLLAYSAAAFVYRTIVLFGIILFVAGKYFFVGIILAAWAAFGIFGVPLYRQIRYLVTDPGLGERRRRAIAVSAGLAVAVISFFALVPMPLRTVAEGVIWLPEDAWVRAEVDGFAHELLVESGDFVEEGQPILRLANEVVQNDVRVFEAQLHEARVRYQAERMEDFSRAQLTGEAIRFLEGRVERALEQRDRLVVRSPADGLIVIPDPSDMPGRYLRRGDSVGWIVDRDEMKGRVVVDLESVDLVRRDTRAVRVRLAERLDTVLPGRLVRELPAATHDLPSAALGAEGGGAVVLAPGAGDAKRAFERLFQFELAIDPPEHFVGFGQRIHVRFEHAPTPLALQWYRALRQLFLARLHV